MAGRLEASHLEASTADRCLSGSTKARIRTEDEMRRGGNLGATDATPTFPDMCHPEASTSFIDGHTHTCTHRTKTV